MKELAEGVWHLNTIPLPNAVNAYLLGDVLVDAGGRRSGSKILRQLEGRTVTAHALTHAHPDHQGASHEICEKLSVPFWVGVNDVDAAEDPTLIKTRQPDQRVAVFYYNFFSLAGYRAESSQALPEGKSTVRVEFAPEEKGYGKPARVTLFVNGQETAKVRVEKTVPVGYSGEGFDVGADNISSVSPDYTSPFAFGGTIRGVTIAQEK